MSRDFDDWYGNKLFESLKGLTITSIENAKKDSDNILFKEQSGRNFRMKYYDDCCASCSVEEIHGDINDLIGTPILLAEVVENHENPEGVTKEYQDSFTWVFYKLSTIKGSVTLRWYGESNGYYSETATFEEIKNED